jgi:hypothetical protein
MEMRINMIILKKIAIASAFAVIFAALVPVAKADQGNWATKMTISQPMQIGNLVLAPGTYEFRLVNIWAPGVVAIYSADTHHYDGIVMGISAQRSHASAMSTFIVKKGTKGAPEELLYWYYPDNLSQVSSSSIPTKRSRLRYTLAVWQLQLAPQATDGAMVQ